MDHIYIYIHTIKLRQTFLFPKRRYQSTKLHNPQNRNPNTHTGPTCATLTQIERTVKVKVKVPPS